MKMNLLLKRGEEVLIQHPSHAALPTRAIMQQKRLKRLFSQNFLPNFVKAKLVWRPFVFWIC